MDTDIDTNRLRPKLHKANGEGPHLCAFFKHLPSSYLEMLFVAVSYPWKESVNILRVGTLVFGIQSRPDIYYALGECMNE